VQGVQLFGWFNPISLPRRSVARLAEFVFLGELGEGIHLFPGFHVAFFGPHLPAYVLVALCGSGLFDLFELAIRPDLYPTPCADAEPQLPLGEEK
jgi:hypothetical protein